MLRSLITIVAVSIAMQSLDLQAEGRHRRSSLRSPLLGFLFGGGSHSYDGKSDFGRSSIPHYGYGYVYDPYRSGSFEAPDLLNEPYFQAQHKFDSRFPGRYSNRAPLQLRENVAPPMHAPAPRNR